MHALHASNPHELEVSDTIVLCDAGGGTIDLITFPIVELGPKLRLKEEVSGNGALCGSTFLNKRFEKMLEERLASCPGWGRDTLEERFENFAKRTFNGAVHYDFNFPVPGIADNEDWSSPRTTPGNGTRDKILVFPSPSSVYRAKSAHLDRMWKQSSWWLWSKSLSPQLPTCFVLSQYRGSGTRWTDRKSVV